VSRRSKQAFDEVVRMLRGLVERRFNEVVERVSVGDVDVVISLYDGDVEVLVLEVLRAARRPLQWRELKQIFHGVVGEDRLRRVVNSLKARNEVVELTGTKFTVPECVSLEDLKLVRNPGVISRILKTKVEGVEEGVW